MQHHTVFGCSMSIAFLFGCGAVVEDDAAEGVDVTSADAESIVFPAAPPIAFPTANPTASPPVSAPVSPPAEPPVELQRYADLQFSGTPISFLDLTGGPTFVSIEVKNVGNAITTSLQGSVSFANVVYPANLYSKTNATSIGPGETGLVTLSVPVSVAKQCQQYTVVIDIDQNWQFDNFGPAVFSNDRATLPAACLTWTSPITEANLGRRPDPRILNKSLESIVSSFERGSSLGYCSHCHNQSSSPGLYSPDVLKDDEGWIWDSEVIDYWRWNGPGGWAVRFVGNPTKPEGLKKAFRKWIANDFPR